MKMTEKVCQHIECEEKAIQLNYCQFHFEGGIFGSGETFEQYQIIEQDFIEYIKFVPLDDKNHLPVHSPILRDIILRSCVQIEIFFKEWSKLKLTNSETKLFKLYHKIEKNGESRKARNWNFHNYFIFKKTLNIDRAIYVKPIDKEIRPFLEWQNNKRNSGLKWWNIYNSIKHNGIQSKKEANLEIALTSLAALFALHCANKYSKNYISSHNIISLLRKSGKFNIQFNQLSSPIGTHQFLFRDVIEESRQIEIDPARKIDRRTFKGKKV